MKPSIGGSDFPLNGQVQHLEQGLRLKWPQIQFRGVRVLEREGTVLGAKHRQGLSQAGCVSGWSGGESIIQQVLTGHQRGCPSPTGHPYLAATNNAQHIFPLCHSHEYSKDIPGPQGAALTSLPETESQGLNSGLRHFANLHPSGQKHGPRHRYESWLSWAFCLGWVLVFWLCGSAPFYPSPWGSNRTSLGLSTSSG